MESLLRTLAGFLLIILIIVLVIYIAVAIFLNKFNKLVYGKGTAMAWLPVFNVYLLGKLAVNKLVGWILVICIFLTGTYKTTINDVETTYTILPEGISSIVSKIYGLANLGLLIYAIIKYNKLKKEGPKTEQATVPQPVQQPTVMIDNQQNVVPQPVQQPAVMIDNQQNVVPQPVQQPAVMPTNQQNVVPQPVQQPAVMPDNQQNVVPQNLVNNQTTNQNPINPNNY